MTGALDSSYAVLVDSVAEVLAARGPLTEDQIVAELRDRGIDLGEFPQELLEDAFDEAIAPVVLLADERWAWLPALLAGRTFTHRLTELEVAHDLLFVTPDLDPADLLLFDDVAGLSDGTEVRSLLLPFDAEELGERGAPVDDVPDDAVLLLPAGYLSGRHIRPDDVIGLRVTADGVSLDVVDVPDRSAATAEFARAIATILERHEPEELGAAIWSVCADHDDLFRDPLPPLRALLATCGLVQNGDWVAWEGFDFGRWRTDLRRDGLMRRHDLSNDEALAVLAGVALYERVAQLYEAAAQNADDPSSLVEVFEELTTGQPTEPTDETSEFRMTMKDALTGLDEPAIVVALLAETTGYDATRAAPLGMFAETLEPLMPRSARPPLRWLRAKAHELLGEIATAEQVLLDAESLDPDWPMTLVDLARYAFDRGDAERGLSLLRRAGAPADDPMVHMLERFQGAPPRTDLGRNDVCWCGSGRKYKKCHLNSEQLPLEDRALWLYEKASLFVMDEPQRELHTDLAAERAQYADSEDEIWAAATDPLVVDALLFEGGVFEDFLTTRGVLLPDDERLLAQQWLLADRSVHEVTEIHPGDGLVLRDLRTGDVLLVRERTAGQYLTTGQLICARILPAGETLQIFGGLEPVALHERDELIALLDSEPDPHELVEFLTRRFAPTVLQNIEGDPLVFCEATLRADDSVALVNILDDTYDRADPAATEWLEHVTTNGMQRISATLRLEGDDLHVDTNSEERHERVLAELRELVPSIALVSESRKPFRDTREAAVLAAGAGPGGSSALDPSDLDVAALIEQVVRDYERRWLDEPIPALAGVTPRQAADDPTRRDDLIKLLDSFPAVDAPDAMSPARLRAALNLPPR
ncbi:SEC-C motif-containing protein [Kribbella sp. VKM Ac-2527]|uniref:SEC-C motif-containing protein n=1 Tax=Kribbella caucasensis TaxID=2512215 RepID=A0A4R6JHQ8_9ACTN|nr:SEC-C domain-containing protein [Kribbella sp. VKM Ac-2527]TDO35117.1 SEC-C motif-containing protein [Kribbella sp. VKM Ac-2527]